MAIVRKPVVYLERLKFYRDEEEPDLLGYQIRYTHTGNWAVVYQNKGRLVDNSLVLEERHGTTQKDKFETFKVLRRRNKGFADRVLKERALEEAKKTRRKLYPRLEDLTA